MISQNGVDLALRFGDLSAKSIALLAVAWIVTLCLRKGSAATRHFIWLSAFVAMLAIPLLMVVVPGQAVGVISRAEVRASKQSVVNESGTAENLSRDRLVFDAPSKSSTFSLPAVSTAYSTPQQSIKASPKHSVFTANLVVTCGCIVWLFGTFIVVAQSILGWRFVCRVGRRADLASDSFGVDRVALSRKIGLTRNWDLRVCAGSKPPAAMTWGFMKPIVLMPKESANWTTERVEAVLLHELAHVRRYDSVSQLIAVITCAFYWFNPAVWLCARAMRAEAETAADDTVIRLGIKPSDYAREILKIAADLGHRRQPTTPIGVPFMKQSKIESRVKAILDPSVRQRRGITSLEALATVAAATALVLPLTLLRAAIVTYVPSAPTGSIIQAAKPHEAQTLTELPGMPESDATKTMEACQTAIKTISKEVQKKAKILAEKKAASKKKRAAEYDKFAKLELEAALSNRKIAIMRAEQQLAQLKQAQVKFERSNALHKQGFVSAQALDEARAARDLAKLSAEQQAQMGQISKANIEMLRANMKQAEMARNLTQNNSKLDQKKVEMLMKLSDEQGRDPLDTGRLQLKLEAMAKAQKAMRLDARLKGLSSNSAKLSAEALQKLMTSDMHQKMDRLKLEEQLATIVGQKEKARIQVDLANRTQWRLSELVKAGAAPTSELQQARAALEAAQMQLKIAQEILNRIHPGK